MDRVFRLPKSVIYDPAIENWMKHHSDELGTVATYWFKIMRECGEDVRETLHDGYPTACVGDAAFAYVGAFKAHVNVGFFCGAELSDPKTLLEGTGKYMRHVKIKPGLDVDDPELRKLIHRAYRDMKSRLNED